MYNFDANFLTKLQWTKSEWSLQFFILVKVGNTGTNPQFIYGESIKVNEALNPNRDYDNLESHQACHVHDANEYYGYLNNTVCPRPFFNFFLLVHFALKLYYSVVTL